MERRNFKAGQVIFKEGDPGNTMFEVVIGSVAIYADYGLPSQKNLDSVGQDGLFGEMSVLDGTPRSATAIAKTAVILNEVTADEFLAYLRSHIAKGLSMLDKMSSTLRQLTQNYMDACRTLAEIEDAEAENRAKSAETLENMRKISDDYRLLTEICPPRA